jgi:hypothetical protein
VAIYTIEYACGHGTFEVEILGDLRARKRKLDQLGKTPCQACVKHKVNYSSASKEVNPFRLIVTIPQITVGTAPYMIIAIGNSFEYKSFLKDRGYHYGLPETVKPDYNLKECWNKRFRESDLKKEIKELTELKITVLKDYTEEEKANSKERCKKFESAEDTKPIWIRNHAWNEIIYGHKTKFIYLDGKKTTITSEQEKILKAYIVQLNNATR